MSADLSNSDKTDGNMNKTKAFTKGDFSVKFLQAGVSELTMAALMNVRLCGNCRLSRSGLMMRSVLAKMAQPINLLSKKPKYV